LRQKKANLESILLKKYILNAAIFYKTPQGQTHILVLFEALLLVGLIGWMDYANGWEYSLFVFYALPIVLIAWKSGRGLGFAFAILCTVTWWGVHIDDNPYQGSWGFTHIITHKSHHLSLSRKTEAGSKVHHTL
jgi:hypothetical protein